MCGIAGIIGRAPLAAFDIDRVRAAARAMVHRGPDGAGEYPAALATEGPGNVFLAMRRLSIIDLEGGWQPLYNEDRSLALVANGEIYNFVELRKELESLGHSFRTRSDCETILHLYEQFDVDCVQHLRGMFAFALWDSRRRRLMLARDRMGEKPLYLARRSEQLLFASETKAVLAGGFVPFSLDPPSIDRYLRFGWVPEPQTAVAGLEKLPRAHWLTVDVDSWHIVTRRYWSLEDAAPRDGDPAELIRAELETIGEQVVRADVPVGVALSSGVDSSIIAALGAKKYPGQLKAFTVGYSDATRSDERAGARELARHLGIELHEIVLDAGAIAESFAELNELRDEPIADIAGHGYSALSHAAYEHGCPVLLQGQGGDELFFGYPWALHAVHGTRLKAAGASALAVRIGSLLGRRPFSRAGVRQLARFLVAHLFGWQRLLPRRPAPADQLVFYDLVEAYAKADYAAPRIYTQRFAESVSPTSAADVFRLPLPWPAAEVAIIKLLCDTYLLQNGLTQGDRLSMAHSVELRLPLIDFKLVELVVGLQKSRLDGACAPKTWLKAAVRDLVPAFALERPKRGFTPPVAKWYAALKARWGTDLVDGYLVANGILDAAAARRLVEPHNRYAAWNDVCFAALVLEQWCRRMAALARRP